MKAFRAKLPCPSVYLTRCSAIAERDRAAGCVIVLAKSGRLELGDTIFTDIIGLSSTTVI